MEEFRGIFSGKIYVFRKNAVIYGDTSGMFSLCFRRVFRFCRNTGECVYWVCGFGGSEIKMGGSMNRGPQHLQNPYDRNSDPKP